MKRLAIVRFMIALTVTLAVLPYVLSLVLVYPMTVGKVEAMWLAIFVATLAGVFALTWNIAPQLNTSRWSKLALLAAIPGWIGSLGVVIALCALPTISLPAVAALFIPATLWAPWAAWLGYNGRPARWKLMTLGGLALGIVPFVALVRVESLAGDAGGVAFAWRSAPRKDFSGPATLDSSAPPLSIGPIAADDSPQFFGLHRDGVYHHLKLVDWSEAPPTEIWRIPVGPGWSSIAAVGGYCFTQEQRGSDECVTCYRMSDGALVWIHKEPGRFESSMGGDGPRATPTIANGKVYAVGAMGRLVCLDAPTGKRIWTVDLMHEFGGPNLMHGVCASPLLVDDRVIVCPPSGPSLAAFHRDTGAILWSAGAQRASYASPTVWEFDRSNQIVTHNRDGVAGHDPANGRQLWFFPWTNYEKINCSVPVLDAAGEHTLLVSSGYGAGAALVGVNRQGPDGWAAIAVWNSPKRLLKTKFTSAVLFEGHVYGLDDGILTCVDAANGKQRWKDGRYRHGQVIVAGDRLIVQAEDGSLVMVAASSSAWKEIARVPALSGKTWNVPTIAGKKLLVRNDGEMVCFELGVK